MVTVKLLLELPLPLDDGGRGGVGIDRGALTLLERECPLVTVMGPLPRDVGLKTVGADGLGAGGVGTDGVDVDLNTG